MTVSIEEIFDYINYRHLLRFHQQLDVDNWLSSDSYFAFINDILKENEDNYTIGNGFYCNPGEFTRIKNTIIDKYGHHIDFNDIFLCRMDRVLKTIWKIGVTI